MARGRKPSIKSQTHFKRANGKGSIKKLSGNRRRPYAAVVTTGYEFNPETFKNKQITVPIGYYKTREEAEIALDEYTLNPYDLDLRNVTFGEIYEMWKKRHFTRLSERTIVSYNSAAKYLSELMNEKIITIKTARLQQVIDKCDRGSSTKDNIKILMSGVFNYCMENDIVNKNYADYLIIEQSDATFDRIPFSKKEIDYLWEVSDQYPAQILLILLYSGMRVNELLKLPHDNVNIKDHYFYVPKELAKNKSSERYIPIHPKIESIVLDFYNRNRSNLIVKENGVKVTYNNFATRELVRLNKHFENQHRCHDTRHTFITKAHEVRMDEKCLKKIVGHTSKDITTNVYTHISNKEMMKEIKKIAY